MIDADLLIVYGAAYKKIKSGGIIFDEGFECNHYFQLVKGQVFCLNVNEKGREFIQEIIEPDESFGEMSVFDSLPYAATAIAAKDSLVLKISKENFTYLLQENPEIQALFNKILAKKIRTKYTMLKTIAYETPEIKILTLFDSHKDKHCQPSNEPTKIDLTRKIIAEMTGLRIETVIRTIKNLDEDGKLRILNGRVYY